MQLPGTRSGSTRAALRQPDDAARRVCVQPTRTAEAATRNEDDSGLRRQRQPADAAGAAVGAEDFPRAGFVLHSALHCLPSRMHALLPGPWRSRRQAWSSALHALMHRW